MREGGSEVGENREGREERRREEEDEEQEQKKGIEGSGRQERRKEGGAVSLTIQMTGLKLPM